MFREGGCVPAKGRYGFREAGCGNRGVVRGNRETGCGFREDACRNWEGVRGKAKSAANKTAAVKVGALIAERAQAKGIQAVVFDRGGHLYHGNVKALAEAAREKGLKF